MNVDPHTWIFNVFPLSVISSNKAEGFGFAKIGTSYI